MQKQIVLLPFLLFAAMLAGRAQAQPAEALPEDPPWYQIEILLFEQTAALDPEGERFPQDISPPADNGARHLLSADQFTPEEDLTAPDSPLLTPADTLQATSPSPEEERPFHLLTNDQFKLQDEERAIRRSSRYILLGHYAWRQPVPAGGEGIPVWLDTRPASAVGDMPEGSMEADPVALSGAATQPVSVEGDEAPPQVERLIPDHVRGLIRISRGRYLHVAPELFHQRLRPVQPVLAETRDQALPLVSLTPAEGAALPPEEAAVEPMPAEPASPYLFYRMSQKRRVRRDELHYFDHPAFGMLVRMTPYDPHEKADDAESPPTRQ